jgi:hypothetical protein
MAKGKLGLWLALLGLTAGCCSNPGLFDQVQRSLQTVQNYYTPLLQAGGWDQEGKLRRAVVAADTTLLLAAELQRQWCPDTQKAQQLELQTQEAQKLAQEAGVAAAESPGGTAPNKSGE